MIFPVFALFDFYMRNAGGRRFFAESRPFSAYWKQKGKNRKIRKEAITVKTRMKNLSALSLFLFLTAFALLPKSVSAAVVVKAQRTDDVNCTGKGIKENVVYVPGNSTEAIPIVMPEDGMLRMSCDRDSYIRLTYDYGGHSPVYSNGILAKGTYYYQARAGYGKTAFRIKAWYYSANERKISPNGRACGVVFRHDDGFYQSQLFRVKFPSRGWIKVSATLPKGMRAAPMIGISSSKKRLFSKAGTLYDQDGNYPAYIAVEKGTYYLFVANMEGPFRLNCEYKKYNEKNWTMKKAVGLKIGKYHASVVYSKDSGKKLTRFYRIKFKKNQVVKITYKTPYATAGIIDSKGKVQPLTTKGNVSRTKKKLKKGTNYYIVLKYNFGNLKKETMGEVALFKWN